MTAGRSEKITFLTGGGFCAAGHFGGRPRRGGSAGMAEAGKYAAFNRKVDMVSVLSPTCSLKNRRDRSRIRYGPLYSGDSGGNLASFLTKTMSACSESGGKLAGSVLLM
jgi:hypothetical protein